MLETKEQKQIFAGSLILIVILGFVSFWHRPDLSAPNDQQAQKSNADFLSSRAYLDYYAAANIDQKASRELLETILTKEEIKAEVDKALQTGRQIIPPSINESKIKISNNSAGAVNNYLTASISQAYKFSTTTAGLAQNIFGDSGSSGQVKSKLQEVISGLYGLSVPKDAVAAHKALITAYTAYGNLVNAGQQYDAGDFSQNDNIWPEVYKNYSIINDSTKQYADELNMLSQKYKISYVPVNYYAESKEKKSLSNIFIPQAQAFLGIGDIVFSTTIGDIPRLIMDGVKEGIKTAFLNFTSTMLSKLIAKIEQNYKIANFLYYTDALVNGQYADDFLNKYVNDPLDRTIVKQFIPQFNCGRNPNLKQLFEAKANSYLGFNPTTLDVNDPNYYQKMARAGDFMASTEGWQVYYEDLASQTQSQAQKAAQQELTSSGLKTPRSSMTSLITSSNSNIVSAQRAGFAALFQLGINNADSIISNVVAKLTETLVNQFVFQGVSSDSGNVVVLKEQKTCVSTAVVNPILPVPPSQYQEPPPAQTPQSAKAEQCSAIADAVESSCTESVMDELQICANNPGSHTGSQTCHDLANSAYVRQLNAQCSILFILSPECRELKSFLSAIQ